MPDPYDSGPHDSDPHGSGPHGPDPYDLDRFVRAQEPAYDRALAELRAGRKETHWVWYVFPQLRGLGSSRTAHRFGIASLEEAAAYLDHEVLGPRLRECAEAVLTQEGKDAEAVMGHPDDLKLRSSMTLFERAAPDRAAPDRARGGGALFAQVLDAFYDGERDEETLRRL